MEYIEQVRSLTEDASSLKLDKIIQCIKDHINERASSGYSYVVISLFTDPIVKLTYKCQGDDITQAIEFFNREGFKIRSRYSEYTISW